MKAMLPNTMNSLKKILFHFCLLSILWMTSALYGRGGQEEKTKDKPAAVKTEFVGSEPCLTCHEDQGKWMKGSVHQALLKNLGKNDGSSGCEACHGAGSVHAEEPSKTNILTFKAESATRRSEACLSCHGKKASLSDYRRAAHRFQQIACDQCHADGDSQKFHSMRSMQDISKADGVRLCLGCHTEMRMAFAMPFRHKVTEGYMKCTDCHTLHGGFRSGRRANEQNNETCARCHPEKGGPFLYEHVPARIGGCLSCHTPHGSTNAKLLTRNTVQMLCLECHNSLPAFHNASLERYRNCTACHTAVHGSNHSKMLME